MRVEIRWKPGDITSLEHVVGYLTSAIKDVITSEGFELKSERHSGNSGECLTTLEIAYSPRFAVRHYTDNDKILCDDRHEDPGEVIHDTVEVSKILGGVVRATVHDCRFCRRIAPSVLRSSQKGKLHWVPAWGGSDEYDNNTTACGLAVLEGGELRCATSDGDFRAGSLGRCAGCWEAWDNEN